MNGLLNIKSTFDGDTAVEYRTDAEVEIKNGAVFISYAENESDYADTTTRLGISPDVVSLNRFGRFPAFFLFSVEQKHLCKISTIFGEADMVVRTDRLRVDIGESYVAVELSYEMLMGEAVSVCDMSLRCDF